MRKCDLHTHICATSPDKKQDKSLCYGDSGSPLVFKNTLVGVVTKTGPDCTLPAYFMLVPFYVPWISDIIKNDT